jgi:hypothetical protein
MQGGAPMGPTRSADIKVAAVLKELPQLQGGGK